jgi:ketosteroid isomerase-like protein
MKRLLSVLMGGTLLWSCAQPKEQEVVAPPAPQALEFAEAKYTEMGRQSLTSLAEGKLDDFGNFYADNAVFMWNNGDSIVSKQAILDYWKDRRANVIDTITFTNEAWMAVQANEPPKHIAKGVWVFNWATFTIAYKTGKSVTMSIHNVFHFDANDKVDRAIQYLDRAPVAAALAKK